MAVPFSAAEWDRVRATHERWWRRELTRPLIVTTVGGYEASGSPPALPASLIEAGYDLAVAPAAMVARWDHDLSRLRWAADGFPTVRPNLGPGCNTAWLGARPEATANTVWFWPPHDLPPHQLRLRCDAANPWWQRTLAIYRAMVAHWGGQVCLGTCDMTPNLDILAAFREPQALLCDLLDAPEEIDRLIAESGEAFAQHFAGLHEVLQPATGGYTCWVPIHSATPFYTLQSDFSYMISPAMFRRFVLPDLERHCRYLARSLYHLDGPGQLPHLDLLLAMPDLDGVQWIPGAGAPPISAWPEVFRRIRGAGKLVQLFGTLADLRTIAEQVGSAAGLCLINHIHRDELPAYQRELERLGWA
jgi:5-methyltetrahydrofolate--homocysteine methyltransferase